MDLQDREVAVDVESNRDVFGPAGTRKRSADSCYLHVGGSRDIYKVTMNFVSSGGHWCETIGGKRCHGNGNGKGQKYGKPSERDKQNPVHWCKHVAAAMGDVEKLAEAQELTAQAFGKSPLKHIPAPAPAPVIEDFQPPAVVESAEDRLAALEVERAALLVTIAEAAAGEELRFAIEGLVGKYGPEAVLQAARKKGARAA